MPDDIAQPDIAEAIGPHLPYLRRYARALTGSQSSGDAYAARDSTNRALEFSALLILPATVALLLIAGPIVKVLFGHGAFTPQDTVATSAALVAFSIGLPAYVLVKILSTGFFAREDTVTPVRVAVVSMAVNIAASLLLIGPLGHIGVALATAIAAWLNTLVLAAILVQRRRHNVVANNFNSLSYRTVLLKHGDSYFITFERHFIYFCLEIRCFSISLEFGSSDFDETLRKCS